MKPRTKQILIVAGAIVVIAAMYFGYDIVEFIEACKP